MASDAGYLRRQKESLDHTLRSPHGETGIIVVIPCFHEPGLLSTLRSLAACRGQRCAVEVIVVFNHPENTPAEVLNQHRQVLKQADSWKKDLSSPRFNITCADAGAVPSSHAGPGFARKLGMDLAVFWFHQLQKPKGIIVSLDADSRCEPDYFTALETHFTTYPSLTGCSIYFEHPLEGDEFPDILYEGIIRYELHMRYHIRALRQTTFPYAFHTVGSCFAVRTDVYVSQGGMNKRKAGEDFYFLHKIIPNGYYRELNSTRIIPSPRPSERVPFGTGPRMSAWLRNPFQPILTYHYDAYRMLASFFAMKEEYYRAGTNEVQKLIRSLPHPLRLFLEHHQAVSAIDEINSNVASVRSFVKRFFGWFNAFRIIKYLNHVHTLGIERIAVKEAVLLLMEDIGMKCGEMVSEKDLLLALREMDRAVEFKTAE